jgi:hypothetical protein
MESNDEWVAEPSSRRESIFGRSKQVGEKPFAVGETADPSPLKRFGMTKTGDLYGAAEAAPLQNRALQRFSASCRDVP